MADYRDDLYSQVDASFIKLEGAKDHFSINNILEDPTPYEQGFQVQPVGWVENASPDIDGAASVLIDSDGITILNGAIFLEDYSGDSVLTPAGFAGSWIDFIESGVYNSQFNAGALQTGLTTESPDLSPNIPMWVVDDVIPTATYGIVDDATYGRCFEVSLSGANTSGIVSFFQDVPIAAEYYHSLHLKMKGTLTHSGLPTDYIANTLIDSEWLDANHDFISSGPTDDGTFDKAGSDDQDIFTLPGTAPVDAVYLRFRITVDLGIDGGTSPVLKMKIRHTEVRQEGSRSIILLDPWEVASEKGHHQIDVLDMGASVPDGGLNIKAGAGLNVFSYTADTEGDPIFAVRKFSDQASMFNVYESGVKIERTTDVTAASSDAPLQIGLESGDNLAFDNNEIMARNNGSASTLFLNKDAGDVSMAGETVIARDTGDIELPVGYLQLGELGGAPAAPASGFKLFADLSAGKVRIRARYPSTTVTLFTEP